MTSSTSLASASAVPVPTVPRTGAGRAAQRILRLNALTGLVSGAALAFGAPAIAALMGLGALPLAVPLAQVTGVGLVLFAAFLLWIARRPVPGPTMLTIGIVDALWAAASAALLVSRILPLSAAGVWIVALQAEVIALLAALEIHRWWRSRTSEGAPRAAS